MFVSISWTFISLHFFPLVSSVFGNRAFCIWIVVQKVLNVEPRTAAKFGNLARGFGGT